MQEAESQDIIQLFGNNKNKLRMKKLFIIASVFLLASLSMQAQAYRALSTFGTDTAAYYTYNFVSYRANFEGKSVAELLKALEVPVGSFVINPSYGNPEYANEFRFSNKDVNTTSTFITDNSNAAGGGKLYILYVQFKPQIKYPTTGFIHDNQEKALSPDQYDEFAKYKIMSIEVGIFPR
jgi:hypothetical protein